MTIFGGAAFMLFVWLALKELGKIIGGDDAAEQIRRSTKLGLISYFAAVVTVLLAGFFNPYGITGLPAVAGSFAVIGALSPLLWMMQWFRAESFKKESKSPLQIHRQWIWIASGAAAIIGYSVILGQTLYF